MYADTKLFANRVLNDIQNAGYYEVTNVDDLEFTFDDIVDDILKRSGTFKFAGMLDHDSTATYYYDDNYFLADASIYNDHLATMSLCFELSTWSSNDGGSWTTDVNASDPKFKNARDLLIGTSDNNESGLEFSNFAVNPFWDGKPTKDSIGAVAAMKTIQNQQESHTLVALGVRGGGYGQEWSSNFTIGETGQHAGFAEAKQNVLDFLSQYITDNEITGNIKLWIVGYSRAGAVANLVAGAINDGYELPNDVKIAAKDLFAYTFEAPQGALTDQITGNHENIHNVINLNDVVPLVAPSAWNFVRYNTTNDIWLPSSYTSKNFKNQKDMMIRQYSKLEGGPSDLEHPGDVYKVKESSTQKNLKIGTSKFLPGGDPLWWWEDSEVAGCN